MAKLKIIRNARGLAAFISLMIMIMLLMVGIAAIKLANDEINIAGNELNEMSAFYAAEAGLEEASASIQSQYESTGAPPSVLPSGSEILNDCIFTYNTVDNGPASQEVLTQGTLAGLNALVKTYSVSSLGISPVNQSQISLTQVFECDLIPIFQFAVFYDNDLEIAPGPDMTLAGRVHTNGDLWLQAGSNLNMDSYVTCAGDLLHGRKGAGSVDNGNVFIKDINGDYQNMKNADGSFLESTDPYWYDSATTRWGGRVQDAAFGQGELNLPLNNGGDAHELIERGTGNPDSYEHIADLKIIDGAAYSKIGAVWQDVTALLPAGTITSASFYDHREQTSVNTTEIDVAGLSSSIYFPANGVIYASDQRAGTFNAVRLTDGADVGKPMSFFSENPMYVKGDFNTTNKQPVALAADAVTFLSNSWIDATSWSGDLNDRIASNTTCNAAIMTGITNTTSSTYNGGLENLPRFLENWGGFPQKIFTYVGSLINLWNSQQATGDWIYGSPVYEAPNRNWVYDPDLDDPGNHPPETPKVQVFQRTRWQQTHVGYILSGDTGIAEI